LHHTKQQQQIDEAGHNVLVKKIEALGLKVHCNARISEVQGEDRVTGLAFSDDKEPLDVGMVIVSAGIRPRDEIARVSGLEVHARGGVVVDDKLKTSHDDIYAIGEVALHRYVMQTILILNALSLQLLVHCS
jgi:nitrite reductase (NADH) large subunit